MISILLDRRYPTQSSKNDRAVVHVIGTMEGVVDPCAWLARRLLTDGRLNDREQIKRLVRTLRGNFCFVIDDGHGNVVAATDKIRSFPLLYRVVNGVCVMGNHMQELCAAASLEKNPDAFLEFSLAGYVTGNRTLFQEISHLRAGEVLFWDGTRAVVEPYYQFYSPHVWQDSHEERLERLHAVTTSIFRRLAERLGGRPAWVPLSGGSDSRLVVSMLKYVGYDHIHTFTFGAPGNHEARRARDVANYLGVPWQFIPYSRQSGRAFFHSAFYREYQRFIPSAVTIPFVLDAPALVELVHSGDMPRDAVVINGLSGDFISGSHEHRDVFGTATVKKQTLLDYIVHRHYSLWQHLLTDVTRADMAAQIERVVSVPLASQTTPNEAVKWYELWEWTARQTTYVLNSQRAYDVLGLAWELPLWDDEYLEFWSRAPAEDKMEQRLYREYLQRQNFFGLFPTEEEPRYLSPASMRMLQGVFAQFGEAGVRCAKTLLSYWQDYAYYYALYPYHEYLKHASDHRGAVSYHVKHVLEHEYQEFIVL